MPTTGWRNDGRNGYAGIFVTANLTIFRLRLTRAASVAKEVLGTEPLSGHLIVDRYRVYQTLRCRLQYCYAHLLRAVKDLGKNFPIHSKCKILSTQPRRFWPKPSNSEICRLRTRFFTNAPITSSLRFNR